MAPIFRKFSTDKRMNIPLATRTSLKNVLVCLILFCIYYSSNGQGYYNFWERKPKYQYALDDYKNEQLNGPVKHLRVSKKTKGYESIYLDLLLDIEKNILEKKKIGNLIDGDSTIKYEVISKFKNNRMFEYYHSYNGRHNLKYDKGKLLKVSFDSFADKKTITTKEIKYIADKIDSIIEWDGTITKFIYQDTLTWKVIFNENNNQKNKIVSRLKTDKTELVSFYYKNNISDIAQLNRELILKRAQLYTLNEEGLLASSESLEYNNTGILSKHTKSIIEYHDQLKIRSLLYENDTIKAITHYFYDSNNRLSRYLRTNLSIKGLPATQIDYEYDQYGNVVLQTIISHQMPWKLGKYGSDVTYTEGQTEYIYEYDKWNNWIEKTELIANPSYNSTTYREITYYK